MNFDQFGAGALDVTPLATQNQGPTLTGSLTGDPNTSATVKVILIFVVVWVILEAFDLIPSRF